jgi:hypothetical protein
MNSTRTQRVRNTGSYSDISVLIRQKESSDIDTITIAPYDKYIADTFNDVLEKKRNGLLVK